jgi:hypothetical protein
MLSLPTDNEFYYYYDECSEKANKKKRGKTFTGRSGMVCISFILWKSDGKLSNFHSVYIIYTRFLTFVDISWIFNGNRTSFHHVHPSVHSGNYVTSTSDSLVQIVEKNKEIYN